MELGGEDAFEPITALIGDWPVQSMSMPIASSQRHGNFFNAIIFSLKLVTPTGIEPVLQP